MIFLVIANAGLPMLALHAPALFFAFIPIVAIESLFSSKYAHISTKEAIRGTALSNLFSTLIGTPITWVLLVIMEMFIGISVSSLFPDMSTDSLWGKVFWLIVSSPWLGPSEGLDWQVYLATLILLIPYFFISVWSERLILYRVWKDVDQNTVAQISLRANGITYGLIAIIIFVCLLVNII